MEIIAPPSDIAEDTQIVKYCHDQGLNVLEVGDYGTYPYKDNSVIQFDNDVFCYTASFADRTVVDPLSGEVKQTGHYGTPVAWAVYEAETSASPKAKTVNDNRSYTALKHETTYSVARKLKDYGFTEAEFVEHNGISPGDLVPGQTYHLPVVPPKPAPQIVYDVYDSPQVMHISRPGGAQKWMFGNVKTIKDIISGSGIYPENKEVDIVATVKIPVGDETFAYCMDALALGSYTQTGKVSYMMGFAWGDLTLGPAPRPAKEPELAEPSQAVIEQIQATLASIEPIEPPIALTPSTPTAAKPKAMWEAPDNVLTHPNQWKSTYEPFLDQWGRPSPEMFIVDLPPGQDEILVHDLDNRMPDKKLHNNGHYRIAGTFIKDGVEYGRPQQSVESPRKNYYGIPSAILKSEAEVYDTTADLPTRMALKAHLTPTEKFVIPKLALTKLSYDRLKLYGRKLTKNKESQP